MRVTVDNVMSAARAAAKKAGGTPKSESVAAMPFRKGGPRQKATKAAAKKPKESAKPSVSPKTSKNPKRLSLDDFRYQPPAGVCFVMTPDQSIVIGGPYDLNQGVTALIEAQRAEPCALFITQQVVLHARMFETQDECVANDFR